MKVNQHQIIAFNAACKYRSFSKAAEALGVTQSSVTQNVAKFEATVGAYLLERRRTGLVLTPAGQRIYRVTEEIGILHTLLDERIGEYAQLERGLLRVAGTACNPAMDYLSRFKERHPGVDITFENASWRECEEALKNRTVDVVLMPEPESRENLYVWPIEERSHAALVYPGHSLFDRETVTISELAEHHLVVASARSFASAKPAAAVTASRSSRRRRSERSCTSVPTCSPWWKMGSETCTPPGRGGSSVFPDPSRNVPSAVARPSRSDGSPSARRSASSRSAGGPGACSSSSSSPTAARESRP